MFSTREKKIIDILGNKKLSYKEIASELFKDEKVLDERILIANSVTRIVKKCDYFELDWTLERVGHPVTLTKRKR